MTMISGAEPALDHVERLLADDPTSHVPIDDPRIVDRLLHHLRRAGAKKQTAILLARDPAAHVMLDNLSDVANVLRSLHKAGALDQVITLADRAVADAYLGEGWTARDLLKALGEVGAKKQAATLVSRLPAEGNFPLFLDQDNNQVLYRFGREPNGAPAEPWGWEDLD